MHELILITLSVFIALILKPLSVLQFVSLEELLKVPC